MMLIWYYCFFFFQAEDGIRDKLVTGVQTCALPIYRARVAHAATRRCGLAGDEPDHGLRHAALRELGGLLLVRAADLPDQHDGIGVRVRLEGGQALDEVGADQGVATDPDAGRLAVTRPRELVDDLVGERPAARHDADAPGLADVPRDDSHLALGG